MASIALRTLATVVFTGLLAFLLLKNQKTGMEALFWKKPYLAPITKLDFPEQELVPQAWTVYLFPDRTIGDLSKATGRDLQQHVHTVINEDSGEVVNRLMFGLKDVDDKLLAEVRSYDGVHSISRIPKMRMPDDG